MCFFFLSVAVFIANENMEYLFKKMSVWFEKQKRKKKLIKLSKFSADCSAVSKYSVAAYPVKYSYSLFYN